MNKEDLLKIKELIENELEKVEKIEESKKSGRYHPILGQHYFYLDDEGAIVDSIWYGVASDLFRFNTGNCFKTRGEASSYKENLLTKQALKDLALELNNGCEIDWSNETQNKYCFVYSHNKNKLDYTPNRAWQELGHIYSLNYNFLKIAKDRIGTEKLIKLIKSGV